MQYTLVGSFPEKVFVTTGFSLTAYLFHSERRSSMFKPCPPRILIADHDPLTLSSLRFQLSILGYLVVAEAADAREAVSLARELCPDVVVMNIAMSNIDGLEACKHIDREALCPIVLLCDCSNEEWIREVCSLLAVQSYQIGRAHV